MANYLHRSSFKLMLPPTIGVTLSLVIPLGYFATFCDSFTFPCHRTGCVKIYVLSQITDLLISTITFFTAVYQIKVFSTAESCLSDAASYQRLTQCNNESRSSTTPRPFYMLCAQLLMTFCCSGAGVTLQQRKGRRQIPITSFLKNK